MTQTCQGIFHLAGTTSVQLTIEPQKDLAVVTGYLKIKSVFLRHEPSLGLVLLTPSVVAVPLKRIFFRPFKTVFAPGTVHLVAISLSAAITIRIALSTLNTSDQSC
jgi:hypothetical protein